MKKIKDYIEELNTIDEHVRIEAKQCTDKIDKSVLESICAFSNEPGLGGGVIMIGLQESHETSCPYRVIGVTDADKLQRDLASQCATMFNHPVRPLIESDHGRNIFTTRILLHHLLSEDDLNWFSSIGMEQLSDGKKTVLIFLREIGAIDNLTYRQLTGLSSREASRELKQLEQSGLILMKGTGRNAYYIPSVKLNALYSVNDATSGPNDASSDS